jgi:multicomponent Na+:H+ antiporter subunit C
MNVATLYGLCAAVLIGIGLYGLIVLPHPLRKILSFNVVGSGVFMLFGALAKRGADASMSADPVPQALLITGIVVAFSATALAVALVVRVIEVSGSATLSSEAPAKGKPETSGPS